MVEASFLINGMINCRETSNQSRGSTPALFIFLLTKKISYYYFTSSAVRSTFCYILVSLKSGCVLKMIVSSNYGCWPGSSYDKIVIAFKYKNVEIALHTVMATWFELCALSVSYILLLIAV